MPTALFVGKQAAISPSIPHHSMSELWSSSGIKKLLAEEVSSARQWFANCHAGLILKFYQTFSVTTESGSPHQHILVHVLSSFELPCGPDLKIMALFSFWSALLPNAALLYLKSQGPSPSSPTFWIAFMSVRRGPDAENRKLVHFISANRNR